MAKQKRTIYAITASKVFPIIMRHFEKAGKPLTKSEIDYIVDELSWQLNRDFSSLKSKVYGFISFHEEWFAQIWFNDQRAFALKKNIKSFDKWEDLVIYALKLAVTPIKNNHFIEDIYALSCNSPSLSFEAENMYILLSEIEDYSYRPKFEGIAYYTKDVNNFLYLPEYKYDYIGLSSYKGRNYARWPFPSNDISLLRVLDNPNIIVTKEYSEYLDYLEDIYWNILKKKIPALHGAIHQLKEVLFCVYDHQCLDEDDAQLIMDYDNCISFMRKRRITPYMQHKDVKIREIYEALIDNWIFYKHRRLALLLDLNTRYYWGLIVEDKKKHTTPLLK